MQIQIVSMSFYQALDTMGKLRDVLGYTRLTLEKLPGIRADLVRLEEDWQKWTDQNPKVVHNSSDKGQKCENLYQTKDSSTNHVCIFCEISRHRESQCQKTSSLDQRRLILPKKKLCFNCTGGKQRRLSITVTKRVFIEKTNTTLQYVIKQHILFLPQIPI